MTYLSITYLLFAYSLSLLLLPTHTLTRLTHALTNEQQGKRNSEVAREAWTAVIKEHVDDVLRRGQTQRCCRGRYGEEDAEYHLHESHLRSVNLLQEHERPARLVDN